MKPMPTNKIKKDFDGRTDAGPVEIAKRVARYCIGRSEKEVAELLGHDVAWVNVQLDYAGLAVGVGWTRSSYGLSVPAAEVAAKIADLVDKFGPDVAVRLEADEDGIFHAASIAGADAEDFEGRLERQILIGHRVPAAAKLARMEMTAERAADAGAITEPLDHAIKRHETPQDRADNWQLQLLKHTLAILMAARFLDESKIHCLRRESTREKVLSANEKLVEQVERIRNLHPDSFDVEW